LALHEEVKAALRDQQLWLVQAQRTMHEVRRWREIESRRVWSPVLWRWWVAVTFSLISTWLAGAGYAWMTEPHAAELERLRRQASFSAFVERRLEKMTPADLRDFERLMGFDQEVAR
jgi:acyl-coenzyme A synthetase/AMP-(fatty) acid ligase